MPREIVVNTVWHARHTIQVPDDWEAGGTDRLELGNDIDGTPVVELLTTAGAELADWEVIDDGR